MPIYLKHIFRVLSKEVKTHKAILFFNFCSLIYPLIKNRAQNKIARISKFAESR